MRVLVVIPQVCCACATTRGSNPQHSVLLPIQGIEICKDADMTEDEKELIKSQADIRSAVAKSAAAGDEQKLVQLACIVFTILKFHPISRYASLVQSKVLRAAKHANSVKTFLLFAATVTCRSF